MCRRINRWNSSTALYCTSELRSNLLQSSNRKRTGLPDLNAPLVSSVDARFMVASFWEARNERDTCSISLLRLCLLSVKIGSGGEPKTEDVSLSVVFVIFCTDLIRGYYSAPLDDVQVNIFSHSCSKGGHQLKSALYVRQNHSEHYKHTQRAMIAEETRVSNFPRYKAARGACVNPHGRSAVCVCVCCSPPLLLSISRLWTVGHGFSGVSSWNHSQ